MDAPTLGSPAPAASGKSGRDGNPYSPIARVGASLLGIRYPNLASKLAPTGLTQARSSFRRRSLQAQKSRPGAPGGGKIGLGRAQLNALANHFW
jgi:hypothetical protein